jgi:2'-5' RNA ligase
LRLFFALWPPVEAARALAKWAREARHGAGGRVTAEDTIHLTLAFLGEADPDKAAAAAAGVRGKAFEMPIEIARHWRHNGIVWAGPRAVPPELEDLAASLKKALSAFNLEDRRFAAHITLVRKASPSTLPNLPAISWAVTEFVLVRSTPSATGSRYEVVERFPLGAGH